MVEGHLRIGEILVAERLATLSDVASALGKQVVDGGRLGTVLVQEEIVGLDDLGRCLAAQHGVPHADERSFLSVTSEALAAVPPGICKKHRVLPLRFEGRTLYLAMIDPLKTVADVVSFAVGVPIRPCVAPELRLLYYLEQLHGLQREPRFLRSRPSASPAEERRRHATPTIDPPAAPRPPRPRETLPFGLAPEPKAPRRAEASTIAERLAAAQSGAAVAALLLEPVLTDTAATVLLWVRGDTAAVVAATGSSVPSEALRRIVVPLTEPSLLRWALDVQGGVIAESGAGSVEAALAAELRLPEAGEICVAPVILKERVVNLVLVQARPGARFEPTALDDLRLVCEGAAAAYERVGERIKRG